MNRAMMERLKQLERREQRGQEVYSVVREVQQWKQRQEIEGQKTRDKLQALFSELLRVGTTVEGIQQN